MQDAFVDVTFEVPTLELAAQRDPSQFLLEKMRDRADELCGRHGASLRTDRPPELIVKQAIDPSTGAYMVLVASRWAVVAPAAVVP